jgi:hypothetical protein
MAGQRISHHVMTNLFPEFFRENSSPSRDFLSRLFPRVYSPTVCLIGCRAVYNLCVKVNGTGVPVMFILANSGMAFNAQCVTFDVSLSNLFMQLA